MTESALIVLGVITGAHGVRGEVKIKPFTAEAENLVAYGPLCDKQGKSYAINIRSAAGTHIIASITGITDRNQAELLRGTELCITRNALPATAEDEYYIEDLVGMAVHLPDGTPYGTLRRIDNFGAGDIVEIECVDRSQIHVAFTEAAFPAIDMTARIITHTPPDIITAKHDE